MPVYFQSVLDASPIGSGVDLLPTALIVAPFAFLGSSSTQFLKRYIPSNVLGWIFSLVGFILLSLLKVDSTKGEWVGYQLIKGIGSGLTVCTTITNIFSSFIIIYRSSFPEHFSQCWHHSQ